jgi:membrane-associated protease RseP (regulator of RpoE activity)
LGPQLELKETEEIFQLTVDAPNADYISIHKLSDGSPGQRSGLKQGDIIMKVNEKGVRNVAEFARAFGLAEIGNTVQMVVWRNDEENVISLQLEGPFSTELSPNSSVLTKALCGTSYKVAFQDFVHDVSQGIQQKVDDVKSGINTTLSKFRSHVEQRMQSITNSVKASNWTQYITAKKEPVLSFFHGISAKIRESSGNFKAQLGDAFAKLRRIGRQ